MHTDLLKALRLESSGVPIYVQLREQILRHLGAGVLAPGDQMPTMRQVAVALKVDLNTVRHAYDELERLGAITLIRGRGSFVAKPPPAMGARAQQAQTDSLAKQVLATAAAMGIDPLAVADRIRGPRQAEGLAVMTPYLNRYIKANGANQPAIVLAVLVAAAAGLLRVARPSNRRACATTGSPACLRSSAALIPAVPDDGQPVGARGRAAARQAAAPFAAPACS